MHQAEQYMQLAIELAKLGVGRVSPNPLVGCVIVKNGKVIARGYHQYFGGPHAEIVALNQAGIKAKGATLYVNLEPCCHLDKKTPPCAPEIIKYGIKNVVIALKDPNPKVNGRGIKQLQDINCLVGILKNEAEELNKFYIKWITKKIPYVILKSAMSIDGKIATFTGDSKWISSDESRRYVHQLRSQVDAVLVGINTVMMDNPELTTHGKGRNPKRVVIDPQLRILADENLALAQPLRSNLASCPVRHYSYAQVRDKAILKVLNHSAETFIITTENVLMGNPGKKLKQKLQLLKEKRCKIVGFKTNSSGVINFNQIMRFLGKQNISSVLIEGGGETNALALKHGIVDEVMFFIAPKIIGGKNAKTPVEGDGIHNLHKTITLKKIAFEKTGNDLLFKGRII